MTGIKKNSSHKSSKFVSFICKLFAIYILIVLVLLNTINLYWGHLFRPDFSDNNLTYLAVALFVPLLGIFVYAFCTRKKCDKLDDSSNQKSDKYFKNTIIIGTVILFILQMIIFAGMAFVSGWEVQFVAFEHPTDPYYFSIYPNNLFLRSIFYFVARFVNATGLGTFIIDVAGHLYPNIQHIIELNIGSKTWLIDWVIGYFIVVFINICLTTISVIMITRIVKKFTNSFVAIITFFFAAIFIGLMPWILVPYSDTFGLFFCTFIFYSYVFCKSRYVKAPLIVFLTIIGFNIKPTVIFVFFAIVIIEVFYLIKNPELNLDYIKLNIKQLLIQLFSTLLIGLLSFCLVGFMKAKTGVVTDENKEYGLAHFLMMGTSPQFEGIWNQSFIDISDSATTQEERTEKNIEKITENLDSLGFKGVVELLYKKTMCNYEDGTFHWGREGTFFRVEIGLFKSIKNFYNNYGPIAQTFWFVVLIGCALFLFRKRYNRQQGVVCLTLLFLSGFLTVFECGSRYLILYLPYFVFVSSFGWKTLGDKVVSLVRNNQINEKS